MAKIVNISEIHPTLGFTEFDILEKIPQSFNESELGKLHSVFPFECMAKAAGLSDRRTGTQEQIQSFRKDRPYGPEGIHRILRQATGGTSEREHTLPDFLWNYNSPVPSHNQLQIVSAIRNEIASRLDIDSFPGAPGFTLETLS